MSTAASSRYGSASLSLKPDVVQHAEKKPGRVEFDETTGRLIRVEDPPEVKDVSQNQSEFVDFCIESKLLKFGEFPRSRSRLCPYWYHTDQFFHGSVLARIGHFFATAIVSENIAFDVLYGSDEHAPLLMSVCESLSTDYGVEKPFHYNRKDIRDAGHPGKAVGGDLKGRVLALFPMIDEDIGAIRDHLKLIKFSPGAKLAGVLSGLDALERGNGDECISEELRHELNIPFHCVIDIQQVVFVLEATDHHVKERMQLDAYVDKYCFNRPCVVRT
eukprot:NODE_3116_length_939_cov_51.814039_g3095_i0.p1 GENE.NODE_3116_length_939_cov_51.814039_g3095_i0~~NODE_3116_length_939_cov_51.814039_g3095_i0.p1  ORF type:complete len:274 (-),score=36.51 NODE_3116_length_939_cov_51.814039_g3095_i0:63-884(-)